MYQINEERRYICLTFDIIINKSWVHGANLKKGQYIHEPKPVSCRLCFSMQDVGLLHPMSCRNSNHSTNQRSLFLGHVSHVREVKTTSYVKLKLSALRSG